MTPAPYLTKTQEHRFYRFAVQASLETFYGKSKSEATRLVRAWWRRLRDSGAFESGLYLHSEPMNTAAGVADMPVIPITARNRETYHRILDESVHLATPDHAPKSMTRADRQSHSVRA